MKKIKEKLYNIFLLLIASLIVGLHIYVRLFQPREGYTLASIKDNASDYYIFFLASFCVMHIIIIVLTSYSLYKKYYNIKTNSYILNKINDVINKIYWNPLEHLHDKIAPDLPGSARLFVFIIKFIKKSNAILRSKIYNNSYIIFSYIPPLITSIIFFVEIVCFNQLKYFFFSLILLLLPLLFSIYLKLCSSFYDRNIINYTKFLDIKEKENTDVNDDPTMIFSFKPEYSQNSKQILEELSQDYTILYYIKFHTEAIKELRDKYYGLILIVISSIYLVAGIYRLYFFL